MRKIALIPELPKKRWKFIPEHVIILYQTAKIDYNHENVPYDRCRRNCRRYYSQKNCHGYWLVESLCNRKPNYHSTIKTQLKLWADKE